ncbi:HAUS augmin-like complex subunit 6 N-terminus-domain-containing protein [Radiomyces spectabilis]|uniref:HAUS augmin-like complex subunit 6 N-terminus-domain-containing protein n=1 Tax=Radiomyces spectabilis TaxID=64574 RepID=UPI00222103D2|nr:HAUS augmin-like complex subunit 6 N-terminus-domain-containing protein [Radiomyces spectabilis]KAI8377420.1 HAUS augmin-like complex subunit 6 N-terminus-domain-containing protein [Radiomyces spectabilis]
MANATASAFLHNLDCLGFRPSLHAKGAFANISFTADIFTRLADNNKAFEATSHFLFEKLNPARARTHFRHCWPIIHYTSQSRLYRLAAFHWLQELKRQNHLPAHILLRRSYLEDCHGQHMNDLMLAFSNYVLKAVQERKKAHTTFVPSIDASGTGDKDTGIKQTTIPSSAKDRN